MVEIFGPKLRHLVDEDDEDTPDVIVLSSEESEDEAAATTVMNDDVAPPEEVGRHLHAAPAPAPSASSRFVQSSLWDYIGYVSESKQSRETYASTAHSKPPPRKKVYAKLFKKQEHNNAGQTSNEPHVAPYVPRMAHSGNTSSCASNGPYGKRSGV